MTVCVCVCEWAWVNVTDWQLHVSSPEMWPLANWSKESSSQASRDYSKGSKGESNRGYIGTE